MSGRSDWLTENAKIVADKLAARSGSLKKILSAGVIALDDMTADEREYYMAKADGVELERPQGFSSDIEKRLEPIIRRIVKKSLAAAKAPQKQKRAASSKSY